jgi:hypothetical protein
MEGILLILATVAVCIFPGLFFINYLREKSKWEILSNEEIGIIKMINKSQTQTFHLPLPIVASENFIDALNSLSEKGIIHALVTQDGRIFYEISTKTYW